MFQDIGLLKLQMIRGLDIAYISIIQFSGTEKDNAFNIRHLNSESDRTHITSMSSANKKKYLNLEINKKIAEYFE